MMTANLEKLTPELQKNLTDFADANNLSVRELAQLYNMRSEERRVGKECRL